MKRLKEMKKDQKGFTLVELIVVLVILAILAAMLVPALLGYIDRAKEGKYEEEVHSIYTALQVIYDEAYAKGTTSMNIGVGDNDELNKMIAPAKVTAIDNVNSKKVDGSAAVALDPKKKEDYTVKSFKVTFNSQDGSTTGITGELSGGAVTVTLNTSGS
ncbi:MAG: prepilin-type N-terminal cleavage/methylation domain-containing protein [Lachnospiraceae bacterium]|nr:prepilin-type N-terminal cleavage/methylation domain-containing protein [Lachnospiraceae bacterium]